MLSMLRILGRQAAAFFRRNPVNALDVLQWIHRYLSRAPAPPAPNPVQAEVGNPAAGNQVVVATASTIRRLIWWTGGGAIAGTIVWLLRRDQGDVDIDLEAGNANAGGGNDGGGGIDPTFLFFQILNFMAWNGGDNRSGGGDSGTGNAGGDSGNDGGDRA